MSHMIDETTGRPAIAYVGATPWHGLGTNLLPGQPISDWASAAGLAHDVLRTPVTYARAPLDDEDGPSPIGTCSDPELRFATMGDRDVLYRSDTGHALSVVSKGYKIVQPREVLDFFAKLAEIGGFDLETAGALSGGRRIWGLAKVNDGAPVVGQDIVRPYVLLATSYDGTLATTAKFTAIRVVCHNTLTMSVGASASETGFAQSKAESDTEGRAVSSLVRIPHSITFDPDAVRLQLGIVKSVFEKWLVETAILSERKLDDGQFDRFVEKLLAPLHPKEIRGKPTKPITEGKPFGRIKSIYDGEMIGGDLAGAGNRWRALNAVTQWADYERGRSPNSRLEGAWFGVGDTIKTRAFNLLSSSEEFATA